MKRGNKKGLSTVIATLLIILLVIVSVAIVWGVIRNIITTNSDQISLDEFTIGLEILSANQLDNVVNVKVKRNAGSGNLEGLIFSIYNGTEKFRFEKRNITLNELEIKTFVIDYSGNIVSISIYPIIKLPSGEIKVGDLADIYYFTSTTGTSGEDDEDGTGEDDETPCLPNCEGKDCGDDGCGGSCATCETGYYCNEGICSQECNSEDCGTRECGALPDRTDCGETFCGTCAEGYYCVEGVCSETCTPICESQGKECGADGCGGSCGTCDEASGYWCEDGQCIAEISLNTGTVYSIWPIDVGIYFDSPDLPTSEETDYANYWVKFPENPLESDCLQIERFVIPIIPEIYDMSYIKLLTASSDMQEGDTYEVWMSYGGCTHQS